MAEVVPQDICISLVPQDNCISVVPPATALTAVLHRHVPMSLLAAGYAPCDTDELTALTTPTTLHD
ncbi:hypothetical protein Vi05172_g3460 [Venturia inaequalis]|nr:hypothetical protein Vi05172_g3460 [Venturia inaequalis]